jgi:hypothetical protein
MRPILAAALASVVLVTAYIALGGRDFGVAAPPDPCRARPALQSPGALGGAERIGLTALGRAACRLGVSRERLLLSLARNRRLPEGITHAQAAGAFRTSLSQTIDEEERTGRLGPSEAFLLRQAVNAVPVEQLLRLLLPGG